METKFFSHSSLEEKREIRDTKKELLKGQEEILMQAVNEVARAIQEIEPNPDYAPVVPQAVIVGGFVRDALIGKKPKDADVEVYGVAPDVLKELLEKMFQNVKPVGEAFGILKVALGNGLELDVSIPRRDSKTGKGHSDFAVDSNPSLDITEAARRRDFTMNALAMDPLTGVIFDPFGGLEDIKARRLCVTDVERFQDDPLRVLRAVQFVARLGLDVETQTWNLLREMVDRGDLLELKKNRVTEEWEKLFLKSERPSVGLKMMRDLGMIEKHQPELQALIDTPQEFEWHPEGDVWTHTLMVVDAAAKLIRQPERNFSDDEAVQVMLGALCHDLGKPATTKMTGGRIRSIGHEEAGEDPACAFMDQFTFSKKYVTRGVIAVTKEHLKPGVFFREVELGRMKKSSYVNAVRKLLRHIYPVSWRVLLAVCEADYRGRAIPGVEKDPYKPGLFFADAVNHYRLNEAVMTPLLQGRDLIEMFHMSPGTNIGVWIRRVEAERDLGHIQTKEEAFAWIKSEWEKE
jgi:tRNA nucleotidyltransferase (CCA-adding enzyme)